ncbi:hypothetical protein FOXG_21933 [Fusarium oxysporum f. sp. lycopersici 4287]|uniref:Uncharacterized protein n=2 Tax=Fusarium oxysporum TaxID=5507 RepID=A0A0J9W2Y3_FUSO4|nr:hypothetical protein FOXG_21933 [Fusarium oxysporum f. sp. lycopersici 4287]KNB17459.1 hypothetical protein FOXG_21933 [Fusarium oxysporum f. sp. lycopersici 4287]
MQLAARANLTMILSDLLQRGLQETEVWKSEREKSSTQTICLFWPNVMGDFVLDLIVSKECAAGIAEARRGSRDALRMVMGDFLFQGMIDSDCFENGVLADTVKVRSYEGSDAIVRIILSHSQGWKASRVFPSAD